MDTNTIVNLVVGGVIGWASGFLPFVKTIGVSNITRIITNVVCGVVGGGAGASFLGPLMGGLGSVMSGNPGDIIGAVAGAGGLSTVASLVLGMLKK